MNNETSGIEWGKVFSGTLLLFVAAGTTFFGLLATAFGADGGVGTAITMFIIFTVATAALVIAGIRLILKGIKFQISAPAINNNQPKSVMKMVSSVLLALLLAIVLNMVPLALGMDTPDLVSFFKVPLFFVSWFIYYGIINKPWVLIKKVGWVIVAFLILQFIAYIPQFLALIIVPTR